MTAERRIANEKLLHEQLIEYFWKTHNLTGNPKMFDPEGEFAFVVIGFNRFSRLDLLPEGSTADDLKLGVASMSAAIMPALQSSDPSGKITTEETIAHGVQAVSAAMLLGTLIGNETVVDIMARAQSAMLRAKPLN